MHTDFHLLGTISWTGAGLWGGVHASVSFRHLELREDTTRKSTFLFCVCGKHFPEDTIQLS